ncbi:phage tail assembly chaperone [Aureimonas mangrovi]|uniref:phage tail assembly chaperone n=1 Tax=Aureimonas mangrovi TaxID=2758041 RepID=UPI00163D5518|nr:hypothetical protein [Aureimonas mangrovi]
MLAEEGDEPQALLDRPSVEPHLLPFWEAFHELSTDRPIGMAGAGPIPFTSIDRYASRFGFDDANEFDRLLRMIRAMDQEYLSNKRPSDQ